MAWLVSTASAIYGRREGGRSMKAAEVVPRPAATVLLVRDGRAGLEVLMVTRNVASDFASGALVFPGGRVDAADGAQAMLEHCRRVPGIDDAALAFRIAGIRESFE